MPPQRAPVSDSDSDSDHGNDSNASSPSHGRSSATRSKQALPAVDFAAGSKGRVVKTSEKRKENEDRDAAAKDAKLATMAKQIKKLQATNAQSKAELRALEGNRDVESEEENDDVEMSAYSGAFVSKGVASRQPVKSAPKKLRKSGETPIATPMSRVPLSDIGDPLNTESPARHLHDEDEVPEDNIVPPSTSPDHQVRRKRRRSRSPKKSRKRTKPTEELPKAEFVTGKAPSGSRTNLKDYKEPAKGLLTRALHKYEVRIWTINPYPGVELQAQWVKEIWVEVCEEANERMELTERMARMIKAYGSHGRSSMKDGVRPVVAPSYGFTVGDSAAIVAKNIAKYKMLIEQSAFHCQVSYHVSSLLSINTYPQSPKERTGTRSGRGVRFAEYFNPISLVTLALIFTAGVFDEMENKDRYDVHFQDLTVWYNLKPSVTSGVLQRMHDQLRASTGATSVKPAGRMTEAARDQALAELEAMEMDGDGWRCRRLVIRLPVHNRFI
ncbi:hypothetical protein DFH06DRAFT_1354030 [Mycena polygramma]|nr:hypothetical protein DFH06DRAFT_1354030 [Mycena polygramma]